MEDDQEDHDLIKEQVNACPCLEIDVSETTKGQSELQRGNDEVRNVGPVASDVKVLIRPPADDANKQVEVLSPAGIALSKVLWRQIRSLQETTKEVNQKLEKERLEQLVAKVENEVEYEGILDTICTNIQIEEEAMEFERREREWELERREVKLEEQVTVLKETVKKLEEDLKIAQVEKSYIAQSKQEEMEDVIQRLLCEARDGDKDSATAEPKDIEALVNPAEDDKPSPSPSHAILIAFEDMLKEADERHEREKQALEETIRAKEEAEHNFRHERHKRRAREKQVESQMIAMHKEIGRLSSLLKERDYAVSVEKERRKVSEEEAVKLSAMVKDEKVGNRLLLVKLKKLESFFARLKEKLARELAEGRKDNEFLKALEKDVGRICAIFNVKKDLPKAVEAEQLEAMKKQRDDAIAERDKAEEKINLLLKRSRDREAEMDAMWLEREKLLIDKMTNLEEQAEQWELKCRRYEEDNTLQKTAWEQETCALKKAWADEKHALELMIREKEDWLKDQEERLQCSLQTKDHELLMLKTVQQKLLNTLALYKKKRTPEEATEGAISSKELKELTASAESDGDEHSCLDFENMASELGEELENRRREMMRKEETVEKEMRELRLGTEKFNTERRELEGKVLGTLSLMEELRSEMKGKEIQMEWEMKQMEAIVTSKSAEIEDLKRELDAKDLELEDRIEKFQNEMQLLEEDIEKERREREKVLDSHFASKKQIATEVQLKEEFWEKDMNRLVQELTGLRAELRKRTEELEAVNMEACVKESQYTTERERLISAQKELEDEVSKLRLENAFLIQELETSRSNKTSSSDSGSTMESMEAKRNAEWQFALGKVAIFDKQINEAMHAIQNLREELSIKELELQKAKSEPELELERREEAWAEAQERQEATYKLREQKLLMEKTELLKLMESERSEASDSIALLHGTIRELHWSLIRKGFKGMSESVEDLIGNLKKKGDMVKVHASHLKDVDQYICELKSKVEELEKSRAGAEKRPTREEELDEALLQVEKELLRYSPDRRFRPTTSAAESLPSSTRPFPRSLEQNLLTTINQPGTSTDRAWNLGGPLSCVPVKDTIEHRWLPQEVLGQEPLALALPASRQQKKWVVDSSWIDHVRKEHSLLTQQLNLERQRLAALGQVESENRWMEAMMLRALQQKKEYEQRLSQLQQKASP